MKKMKYAIAVQWLLSNLIKTKHLLTLVIVLMLWYFYLNYNLNHHEKLTHRSTTKNKTEGAVDSTDINIFVPSSFEKKDWHNYTQIEYERQRVGICEQGKPCSIPKEEFTEEMRDLYYFFGYNAPLSDRIPLNRSLHDYRHSDCKKRQYLKSIPKVSIIIPYYNEHLNTLLRSVLSVLYRTPEQLIKEIFLVDDGSNTDDLRDKLQNKIKEHMPNVKLIHLPTNDGLVAARLAGARAATADVLVFLDAHIEANVNWLPPLLEPIALDYKTVVTPLIDVIDYMNFEHRQMDLGKRGLTDWMINYSRHPLPPHISKKLPEPFETPIMMGGLFAISRRFFWELGGYDPELKFWGGEQFELSFKIWMCGGRMLEAPCSNVAHLYRDTIPDTPGPGLSYYAAKNYVRVAKVWMDDYIENLYIKKPHYRDIDPGDLTVQKELRKKLKCKPFKWFVSQIMYDLLQQYPLDNPAPYASGQIRPHKNPKLCVDANDMKETSFIYLRPCIPKDANINWLENTQYYDLTWFNDVKLKAFYLCWDIVTAEGGPGIRVVLFACHRDGGQQQWRYDEETKQMEHYSGYCLDYELNSPELFINVCDDESETQMWDIDVVRSEQLAKWNESHNVRVTGPIEKWID